MDTLTKLKNLSSQLENPEFVDKFSKEFEEFLNKQKEKSGELGVVNKMVCFFGENNVNGYLSNFYPVEFKMDGKTFTSSEQAFMFKKAIYFKDNHNASLILKARTPKEAKALGRKVRNFNQDEWSRVSSDIMEEVLICKFSQNNDIKKKLVDTGDSELVEASPYDRIWGVGVRITDALDKRMWKGQNKLGKALTNVRELIKE